MTNTPEDAPVEDEGDDDDDDEPFPFTPVMLRLRADGWTAEKQEDFITALAETACVEAACAHVRMSVAGAYRLRARPDARSFRLAWAAALDVGIARLTDAAVSRAIYGVPVPHFYQGEQVGEHRRYDERLTMWLLRYRDPTTYGKWLDRREARQHPEGRPMLLLRRLHELMGDLWGIAVRRTWMGPRFADDEEERGR